MKSKARAAYASLVIAVLVTSGCANLNTVGRSTATAKNGVAIHLDAPQRIAMTNEKGWVCAEPSPDALQAYASSMGLGLGAPSKESVSIAQALSASAGSIGLRTQSITLMRDALYRICEMYFNRAISKEAAIQLLQRSQDMSMGILAIEQLTGAVVAQQVTINSSSAATAAAAINDTAKELERATAEDAAKTTAAEKTQEALDAQKKVVATKTTEATAAKAKAVTTQQYIDKNTPAYDRATEALATADFNLTATEIEAGTSQTSFDELTARDAALPGVSVDLGKKTADAQAAYDKASEADKPALKLALERAKKAEAAAKSEKEKMPAALVAAKVLKDKNNAALVTATDKQKEAKATWQILDDNISLARAQPNQVLADKAVADLKRATADEKKKQDAADESKKALEKAKANTSEIAKLGSSATSNAAASGSGTANFSTLRERYGVSAETVKELSAATLAIVQTVVNKGHLTDTCAILLMSHVNDQPALQRITPICAQVIAATLEVYKATAKAKLAAGAGGANSIQPAASALQATQ